MITFKRINIPIFDYKLTIVIFDDYKGGNKVYKYFREA